jgi:hypothetical protein
VFVSDLLRRLAAIMVVVAIIGTASYAFLGSIAGLGTAGRAGIAVQTVSGYTVSSVDYTYDAADANKIQAVSFILDGRASMVKVRLSHPVYRCAVDNAATAIARSVPGHADWTAYTCDTRSPQATVSTQDRLSIVAR